MKKNGKNKKTAPAVGKYVATVPDTELDKANKKRAAFIFGSTLIFAACLFVPQNSMYKLLTVYWLATAYCLLQIALVVISVWTSYSMFCRSKIRNEIPETDAPKNGFDRSTFRQFDWFAVFHALWAISEIALVIWTFDWIGLAVAIAATASFALSVCARQTSFNALKGKTRYIPPIVPDMPKNVTEDKNKTESENEDGNAETKVTETEKPPIEAEETEDFYGDGE